MMCLLLTFHSYHEALSGQSYEQYLSDLEQIHVQMFKEKLLKELGLSSVPNISKEQTPKFPKFFKDYLESELKDFAAKHTDSNNLKTGKEDLFLFAKQGTFCFRTTMIKLCMMYNFKTILGFNKKAEEVKQRQFLFICDGSITYI